MKFSKCILLLISFFLLSPSFVESGFTSVDSLHKSMISIKSLKWNSWVTPSKLK